MKNLGLLLMIGIWTLQSCSSNYYPTFSSGNSTSKSNNPVINTEKEYNELKTTYKKETADVLNSLLNDNSDSDETTITVTNYSSCNMVLTISGNNRFLKKIPIESNGGIGYAMVKKNEQYKLSGMLCKSVYQTTKYITTHYSVSLKP